MKIIVAIGGSSGSIYAKILLDRLKVIVNQTEAIGVVMSDNAIYNWELEIGPWSKDEYPFTFYNKMDFMAPFASGSAKYELMLVCPCSMGLLGRIAAGISTDLTTRAADVILKERRKLILVTREMPLSLIHIRNMETVTLAGGIICPATPSFYGKPSTIEEVAGTVIDRVLDLSGLDWHSFRWGE
ncbi:MAG: UbiX family flavin prenyltransferase [Saprospiraceae bacterium]|jgi:4-hydroxy-3-polyprenylbenzoate decarboxylase|nr:UbiX family flavin prenyltransferase [Saprospiraceae bacterium]MCF8317191.1 UbiX family flavin prenyltransferase [Haliscomenobacter sp.]